MSKKKQISWLHLLLALLILSQCFLLYFNASSQIYFYTSITTALICFGILFLNDKKSPLIITKTDATNNTTDLSQNDAQFSTLLEEHNNELEMAKRVQQGLLSVYNTDIEGVSISKKCLPASSVSGDFYSFFISGTTGSTSKSSIPGVMQYQEKSDRILGVVIGDVAGHGMSSALVMALASGILNEVSKTTSKPSDVLQLANQNLVTYIKNSHIRYVTSFYASINLDTKLLTYSKAGHPAAYIIRNEQIIELETGGIFLGMYEDEEYEQSNLQLEPKDRLFLYTDGLLETKNKTEELYGIERLHQISIETKQLPVKEAETSIYKSVQSFGATDEIADDQTLIIVEID
ncbi:serine/threonine-protein phosphatase [bacterium]|jgi:serine phosphatase RsbU (regulator of sigma subunit)|nr:serine/threonine-protein phosphatase [bacterium]